MQLRYRDGRGPSFHDFLSRHSLFAIPIYSGSGVPGERGIQKYTCVFPSFGLFSLVLCRYVEGKFTEIGATWDCVLPVRLDPAH